MPKFRLSLLGGFRLDAADGGEVVIQSRKARGVLSVLALSGSGSVTRERIAAMFWGDLAEERARHNLRQLLTILQREVGIVEASGESILLDPLVCTSDAAEFQRLAASVDPKALEAAVTLYAEPLLDRLASKDEAFEEWLQCERARFSKIATDAMSRFAAHLTAQLAHEGAERVLQLLLQTDPFHEEAHRMMMCSLDAQGRRSEALARYQACRELFLKRLGVEPDAATRALYESFRREGSGATGRKGTGLCVLAVLPLANVARTPGLEALAASMVEDLGGHLSRLPGFRVVAQAAVSSALQANPGVLEHLARILHSAYLVTGSLRQPESGRVRAAIQVVDGSNLQYLWSVQQDLDVSDFPASIDDFIAGASAKIEQQITLAEARVGGTRSQDHVAWDKMRLAGSALFSAGWSEEAVETSIRLYSEAIALDPKLALARAQKSLIMALAKRWGLLQGDGAEAEARAEAEKALEMEPTTSEVLGCARCALADLGEPDRARHLIERAIEENPGNAQAWAALGATCIIQNDYEAGVEALRRVLGTSPTDYRHTVWLTALCGGLARLKRLDEALEAAQSACRSDAWFYPARLVQAMVLEKLGRQPEAAKALAEARRIRPRLSKAEIQLWVGRALDSRAAAVGL
jgi:DNA-binding SARP family transcriptional activator/Tfp pilus assembly protein PilF